MFTRTVTFTGAADIDAGVKYVQDTAAPLLRAQRGCRGVTASADRSGGMLGVLSLWETWADREASESALIKARDEALRLIGGQITVEHFEEMLTEIAAAPSAGSYLLLQRISMDPAAIDDNLSFFRRQVMPEIKAQPGFCAVRNMMNRETGVGVSATVWADRAAMDAAAEAAETRRHRAAQQGVTFGDQSKREIVFTDLR
jgi:quinol monooxygenase YgiN